MPLAAAHAGGVVCGADAVAVGLGVAVRGHPVGVLGADRVRRHHLLRQPDQPGAAHPARLRHLLHALHLLQEQVT